MGDSILYGPSRVPEGKYIVQRIIGQERRSGQRRIPTYKCGEGQACRTPYLEYEHEEAPAHRGRIAGYPKMRPNPDTLAIVPG